MPTAETTNYSLLCGKSAFCASRGDKHLGVCRAGNFCSGKAASEDLLPVTGPFYTAEFKLVSYEESRLDSPAGLIPSRHPAADSLTQKDDTVRTINTYTRYTFA